MSTISPDLAHEVSELRQRLSQMEQVRTTLSTAPSNTAKVPTWLGIVNVGTLLTLALTIITFAYYLGGLNNTVSNTALNVDKLNTAVTGTSRDSVASRLSVIETKLDSAINAKPSSKTE